MSTRTTTSESRAAYELALAEGASTYIGHPCKCGSNVRYVGSGGYKCKTCSHRRTLAYIKANKERINARRRERRLSAQMRTPEPLTAAGRLGSLANRTDERDCTKIEH